jgi:DNA-binding NarL/FixJ family response regulator
VIERNLYPRERILKRVLVISSTDLLSVGVADFLNREDDIEVIKKNITDNSALVDAIKEVRPAVLIINESFLHTDCFSIFGWLKDFPDWYVIALNEQKNLLDIYQKQEVTLGEASDLIAIIRSFPSLSGMYAVRFESSDNNQE